MLGAGALLLTLVTAEALRLLPAVRDVRAGVAGLQDGATELGSTPSGWTASRISGTAALQRHAAQEVGSGAAVIENDPLVAIARSLPWVGDQVHAMDHVLGGVLAASRALDDAVQVARAYDAERGDSGSAGPRLLHLIDATAGPLRDGEAGLTPALAALRTDGGHALLPPVRRWVDQAVSRIAPVRDQMAAGATAARFAPAALGAGGTRTYLVLFANPSELRPSGGFAGAVGTVAFTAGTPADLQVRDHQYFNAMLKERFPIPVALNRYLTFYHDSLELGDSGWDPDFPTSARLAERMYGSATGRGVDGTISIDPYAISAMLGVTGPVDVAGYGTFTAADVYARLNFIVNVSHASGAGKGALAPIAQALLHAVLAQPATRWSKLFQAFADSATGRHIQVYAHDPGLAAAAAAAHWDGALLSAPDDYLMVVDANVGATKGDYYLTRSVSLTAEVPDNGLSRHEVRVRYTLPAPVDDTDRALNPGDGSYRDYVRVYIPENASLAQLTFEQDGQLGHGGLDGVGLEHGRRYIAAFFVLQRGHTGELRVDYTVGLAGGGRWSLQLQKQAGLPTAEVALRVSYPGGELAADTTLADDRRFEARW